MAPKKVKIANVFPLLFFVVLDPGSALGFRMEKSGSGVQE
jgi:hypothetical protein